MAKKLYYLDNERKMYGLLDIITACNKDSTTVGHLNGDLVFVIEVIFRADVAAL